MAILYRIVMEELTNEVTFDLEPHLADGFTLDCTASFAVMPCWRDIFTNTCGSYTCFHKFDIMSNKITYLLECSNHLPTTIFPRAAASHTFLEELC